jgi:methionine-rich copper-binding protein CopC
MARPDPPRPRRTAGRVALLTVLVCAALALNPGAGWASDGLTSADPADGAALDAAPGAVVLMFSASPEPDLSHVSTRDGSGTEVGTGAVVRAGSAGLRLPVSIRSTGDYTIAYHVVFDDGTDVIGVLRFSVGTGVPPPRLDTAQAAKVRRSVAAGHEHTVDPLSGSLLVVDLVVLVSVVLLLLRRPANPPRGP